MYLLAMAFPSALLHSKGTLHLILNLYYLSANLCEQCSKANTIVTSQGDITSFWV